MFRTFAMVSMSVICMLPGTLMGAALALEAVDPAPAGVEMQRRAPVTVEHAIPTAGPHDRLVKNIGCIGYHGTGSGYSTNGRCAA